MQGFLDGPVRPLAMPPEKGKRRAMSCRTAARRPTVAELERSERIIADTLLAFAVTAAALGVPSLAAAIYQAVAL